MYNSYYEKILATGEVKCIDEEIPFEIPESWEWSRFGCLMINRDCERVPLSSTQRRTLDKLYDYYGASGIIDKVDNYLFDKNLLLIGEDGANLINRSTPIAFIATGKYWVNNHAHVLDVCGGLTLEYISLYINAIPLTKYVTGTAQPKMNQEKMNSILVSIPPIQEQLRIVNKIDCCSPIINNLYAIQQRLESIENNLYPQLRKSLLQYAIQGKLIAQCDTDEPATELLKRIHEERLNLVKQGKLKGKDVSESTIFRSDDNRYYEKVGKVITDITEDLPYEIPESWQWVSLDMITYLVGTKHNQIQTKDILKTGDYPVVSQGQNLIEGFCDDATKVISNIPLIMFGDHTRNVKYVDFPFVIGADGTKFHKCILVNEKYVYYWMIVGAEQLNDRGYARHYSLLKKKFIPLPPLAEQTRIVNALNSVLKSIEGV